SLTLPLSLSSSSAQPVLHSLPTRRSSDLNVERPHPSVRASKNRPSSPGAEPAGSTAGSPRPADHPIVDRGGSAARRPRPDRRPGAARHPSEEKERKNPPCAAGHQSPDQPGKRPDGAGQDQSRLRPRRRPPLHHPNRGILSGRPRRPLREGQHEGLSEHRRSVPGRRRKQPPLLLLSGPPLSQGAHASERIPGARLHPGPDRNQRL